MILRLVILIGASALGAEPLVTGFERFHASAPTAEGGRLLYNELGCVNCHGGETGLPAMRGPALATVTQRVRSEWLRKFVADPASVHPGAVMPQVLAKADDKTLVAIEHYLASLKPKTASKGPAKILHVNGARGGELFNTLGCVACHAPGKGFVPPDGLPKDSEFTHRSVAFGDLTGLDPANKTLTLGEIRDQDGAVLVAPRTLAFNTLVLAIGSGSNLFNTPGAAEHAHLLEDVADAEAFNKRLTSAFLAAAYSDDRRLSIAIVGAGATGVELSTELIEGHDELSAGLTPDQRFDIDVTIVEAAPRILGGLPERVSTKAAQALEKALAEKAALEIYLPQQMTAEEIAEFAKGKIAGGASGESVWPSSATTGLPCPRVAQRFFTGPKSSCSQRKPARASRSDTSAWQPASSGVTDGRAISSFVRASTSLIS